MSTVSNVASGASRRRRARGRPRLQNHIRRTIWCSPSHGRQHPFDENLSRWNDRADHHRVLQEAGNSMRARRTPVPAALKAAWGPLSAFAGEEDMEAPFGARRRRALANAELARFGTNGIAIAWAPADIHGRCVASLQTRARRFGSTALTTRHFLLLYSAMLVAASGNTALQSLGKCRRWREIGIGDFWVAIAYTWSAVLWVSARPTGRRRAITTGARFLTIMGVTGFIVSMLLCGLVPPA